MLRRLLLKNVESIEDVLLGRLRVMTQLNQYLLSKHLPMYWSPTGFNPKYQIDLKSVGFDIEYWCFTLHVDHLPTGSSTKIGLKPTVPMPLDFQVKKVES